MHWVFEAKKRLGLSVLNYKVTSNHVHLLVNDTGSNVIAQSMQLIAGRTGQEYNQRKGGKERSGKTAITPPRLRPASACIAAFIYIYVTITSMIAGLPLWLASRPCLSASWSFSGSVTCSP